MHNQDKIIFTNVFGTVSDKRIILKYKEGKKEFSVEQVKTAFLQPSTIFTPRVHWIVFIAFLVMIVFGVIDISRLEGDDFLYLLAYLAFHWLFFAWKMYYKIIVISSGEEIKPLRVEKQQKTEGQQFIDALKKVIPKGENKEVIKDGIKN